MQRAPWHAAVPVALLATMALAAGTPADAPAGAPAVNRVEARSEDLLVVGVTRGENMSIHVSQLMDNAPVRDAAVTVKVRGASHPTVAAADGSYTLSTKELTLPGDTGVEFQIVMPTGTESIAGTLKADTTQPGEEKSNSRQLWWWVLNFGACIGFLWLFSRRKKAGAE